VEPLNFELPREQILSVIDDTHEQHRIKELSKWLKFYYDLWSPRVCDPEAVDLDDIRDVNEYVLNIYYLWSALKRYASNTLYVFYPTDEETPRAASRQGDTRENS
jgi:hypothetical protein